jgi:ParB family chromosome partitioning protein
MELVNIAMGKLSISPANMRHGKKPPDISDILPSIRARGVLVPLLVRPNGAPDCFEIVAGRRRFHAAQAVIEEGGTVEALPCAVMAAGDDAAALEASLIENVARLDPDEVTQWETFTRLVKESRGIEDIAATFGMPVMAVRRVLALGNLLARIRDLYRKEKIDAATVRHLTLASKSQQKAWLALHDDPDAYAPTGQRLKAWLFGGQSISTAVALFPLDQYPGQIVSDLFGEESYFADVEAFWAFQNAAIEERRTAYLEAGWSDVVIVPPSDHFSTWEYERVQKRRGGRVYIDVRSHGEVTCHEGYLSRKDAKRLAKGDGLDSDPKPVRAEVTNIMQTYIDLHRHAAVRATLVDRSSVALRLLVAHAIAGSALWHVRPEPQRANDMVTESVETSASEAAFDEKRRAVLALLGFDAEAANITGENGSVADVFQCLLGHSDADVGLVAAVVMGETLEAGSAIVDAIGVHLQVDMGAVWQPDDAFFDLIRDREVVTALTVEVAGQMVADANARETLKTRKAVIQDCLTGCNGRPKVENWLPRWFRFPIAAYTDRGEGQSAR